MGKSFNRKIIISGAVILLLAVGAVLAYFITVHKVLYHFDTVDSGKLYRSGTLSPAGLAWARKISGFRTIVNVRSVEENKLPWHRLEKEFCSEHDINMIDIPLEPDIPPSPGQIKQFLDIVKNKKNLPVIVHCHQGVTRTSMMVAVYEIAVNRKDNKLVLNQMNTFGHDFAKADKRKISDFILTYGHKED